MATIPQEELFLKQNETVSQYNARIAALRGDTPEELARTQKAISAETVGAARAALPPISVPERLSGADLAPTPTPPVPEPTAPLIQQQFIESTAKTVETARTTLETTQAKQLEDAQKRIEEANNKIADLTAKQEGVITGEAQTLLQPFREQLETAERERLFINENFTQNQKLVNELDTFLTEGNALISAERARPVATSIVAARTNRAIQDVAARAGVIQAVMSARNGQIAQAERMIDRSVAAITADRNDRLTYLNTLVKFYDEAKDEEGKKLAILTKDEKDIIGSQVKLLEDDLKNAEDYAQKIKEGMADPDTAAAYAFAGVTLNDSPQAVNEKLAKYAYSKEIADLSNDMAQKGFTYLVPGQSAPKGMEVVTTTDSQGVTKQYYKKATGVPGAGLFFDESGKEMTPIEAGQSIADANPDLSDEELFLAISENVVDTKGKNLLSVTEINKLIASRPQAQLTSESIKQKIVSTLSAQKDLFTRSEAKSAAEQQLRASLGLKADEGLPEAFEGAIEDALIEVYGRTFWQKVLPFGR